MNDDRITVDEYLEDKESIRFILKRGALSDIEFYLKERDIQRALDTSETLSNLMPNCEPVQELKDAIKTGRDKDEIVDLIDQSFIIIAKRQMNYSVENEDWNRVQELCNEILKLEQHSTQSFEKEDYKRAKEILLGIVFDKAKRKILIGRRQSDPFIPELSWCFPGGELKHEQEIDTALKKRIKDKTGFEVKNHRTMFTKICPEQKDLLAIYFLCEIISGEEELKDDFVELKWVDPEELEKYFTTSFHPDLKSQIITLN